MYRCARATEFTAVGVFPLTFRFVQGASLQYWWQQRRGRYIVRIGCQAGFRPAAAWCAEDY